MKVLKIFGAVLLVIITIIIAISLMFGAQWLGLQWKGFFAKESQKIEREVFKESRSYNEGMIQQLARYKAQYDLADTPEKKESIASVVRQMYADYDADKIENESLANFLRNVL